MINENIKVLLIEDSPLSAKKIQKMLDEAKSVNFNVESECVDCLADGLNCLAESGIDIVLLDLSLPDSDGVESYIKVQSHTPEVPIIVLSGLEDESLAMECVQKGAQDYLVKGKVDSPLLKRSIIYSLERKRTEEALRKYRKHLEELVEKRTAKLKKANDKLRSEITKRKRAEKKLMRLNKELERSNKELEQFAYVASHDLQEPLRMVASYTQLLADRYKGKVDETADDFIHFAVEGANRMQALIEALLSFSRLNTKKEYVEMTNSEAALAQAVTNLNKQIEERCAKITHDPLPVINAAWSQFIQLFQNLISNAIKFNDNKVPRVHITAYQNGEEWIFSVRDNGIGFDTEYKDRIFVIFQRLHGREHYPGTGIGLALCKKIVERHGGRIWVKSEPGKGSSFNFAIPTHGGDRDE